MKTNCYIKKVVFTYIFLSFFFAPLYGQKEISITDFIEKTSLYKKQKTDSLNTRLGSIDLNTPLIKGIQIRTETDNFQLNNQEYVIRVSPNSFKTMKNEKKAFINEIEQLKIESEINNIKDLKERCFLVIKYIFTNDLIKLHKKQQSSLKNQLKFLNQKIYDFNFEIEDVIDAEEDIQKIELILFNLKKQKHNLNKALKQYLKLEDEIVFTSDDFIKPEQIIDLPTNIDKNNQNSLQLLQFKAQLNQLENEYKANKYESKQVLDYAQIKYSGKNNSLFRESFSIGIGVNLPFTGVTKKQKQLFLYDKIKITNKYNLLKEDLFKNKEKLTNEFKSSKLNYIMLLKQLEESNIPSLLATYKKIKGFSPLKILKLENLINNRNIKTVEAKQKLYEAYVNLKILDLFYLKTPIFNILK